jgi:hypothetical protein
MAYPSRSRNRVSMSRRTWCSSSFESLRISRRTSSADVTKAPAGRTLLRVRARESAKKLRLIKETFTPHLRRVLGGFSRFRRSPVRSRIRSRLDGFGALVITQLPPAAELHSSVAEDARLASLDWSPPGISDLDPYSQSDWSLVWSPLASSPAGPHFSCAYAHAHA